MKVLGAIIIATITTMAILAAPAATGSTEVRAVKPRVLCLNYGAGNFYVRSRPARCDYYSARAPDDPIVAMAIAPTKSVRWTHWGFRSAVGRGRYHVNGPGFIPARFRLLRPKNACGRKMFTVIRIRMKVPGEGWQRWGSRAPIRSCP